jgi:hypothetical protein
MPQIKGKLQISQPKRKYSEKKFVIDSKNKQVIEIYIYIYNFREY